MAFDSAVRTRRTGLTEAHPMVPAKKLDASGSHVVAFAVREIMREPLPLEVSIVDDACRGRLNLRKSARNLGLKPS